MTTITLPRALLEQALGALEYRDGDGADQWKADVITSIRAALAQEQAEPKQAPLGAWQPIETAPRDGTWVLLAGGYCDDEDVDGNESRVVSGHWTDYLNGRIDKLYGRWQFAWYDGGYFGEYLRPTHWMPLPGPAEPTTPLFVGRRSALEKDK